jgi:hypothetical protein
MSLNSTSKLDCVLDGVLGYFEATLYGDIKLSNFPATKTPGLVLYPPLYFPLMVRQFNNHLFFINTNMDPFMNPHE